MLSITALVDIDMHGGGLDLALNAYSYIQLAIDRWDLVVLVVTVEHILSENITARVRSSALICR